MEDACQNAVSRMTQLMTLKFDSLKTEHGLPLDIMTMSWFCNLSIGYAISMTKKDTSLTNTNSVRTVNVVKAKERVPQVPI